MKGVLALNYYQSNAMCYPPQMNLPMESVAPMARSGAAIAMPLAMAYVPLQVWTQTYEASVGLSRGTVFPELDLPFMGIGGRCR